MSFKYIIGQNRAVSMLQNAVLKDRIAHAYLFLGQDGVGKRYTALNFAKVLNCKEGVVDSIDCCDVCNSCIKVDKNSHPDVRIIEPIKDFVKIEQIREMCRGLSFKTFEGNYKIAIISEAQKMTNSASNALLKTLEEPPKDSIIVLLSNSLIEMTQTIVSRCQKLYFSSIGTNSIKTLIQQRHGLDEEQALLIASHSEGSIGRALNFDEELFFKYRIELLSKFIKLLLGEPEEDVFDLTQNITELDISIDIVLDLLKTYFRDAVVLKIKTGSLINSDLRDDIKIVSENFSLHKLFDISDNIESAKIALARNVNAKYVIERMFFNII